MKRMLRVALKTPGSQAQSPAPRMMSGAVKHVAMWNGFISLWFQDESEPTERTFRVVGTCDPVHDNEQYVGTALDGPYAWHVVEVLAPE